MGYQDGLRRNLKLYYLIDFLVALEFIIPVWVAFYSRLFSFAEIALLHAFGYALSIVMELPSGALADLIGRKRALMLGWFLSALGYLILAFSPDRISFIIGFCIESIGMAFVSGSDVALIYDSFKELQMESKFSSYIARTSFVYRMALTTGTFLGGFLYEIFVGLPYALLGVSQLISLIFIALLVEPQIDSEKFTLKNYVSQTREGFKEIWKNHYMKLLTVFYTLIGGITWSCLAYFNQPFAKDLGFSEVGQSYLFGSGYLISSMIILALTHNDSLIKKNWFFKWFPLLIVISLLPGVFISKTWVPFVILLVLLTGSGRFAFLDKYVNEEFASKYRATALSALNMLVSLFFIFLVGVSGFIQDVYGTPIIFSALGLITLVVVVPLGFQLAKHKA